MPHTSLATLIDAAFEKRAEFNAKNAPADVRDAVDKALMLLDNGAARVAEKIDGTWRVNEWLKKAVLLSFRLHDNRVIDAGYTQFFDKVPLKYSGYDEARFRAEGVRVVPSAIVRRGAYVAPNAILMPSYVNLGAYVGEGTMVDTWVTVGSCAQVGKNVHLSGGVGLGGVLNVGPTGYSLYLAQLSDDVGTYTTSTASPSSSPAQPSSSSKPTPTTGQPSYAYCGSSTTKASGIYYTC